MSAINELDDVDAAVEWLLKGRPYAAGFERYLPHTTEDLRDGKVTPEQVADDLDAIYAERKINYEGMGGMGIDEDDVRDIGSAVGIAAIPDKYFIAAGLDVSKGRREDCLTFFLTFLSIFKRNAEADPGNMDLQLNVKQATDEACEEWSERLDALLFRGKKGTFLKKSPLYQIQPRRFSEHKMPLDMLPVYQKNRRDKKRYDFLSVAKDVVKGVCDIKKTCWQCNERKEDGSLLQICGKCEVSRYCSRKCQVDAWRLGHKSACKSLRARYDEFQLSLQLVDKAHSGSISEVPGMESCGDFRLNDSIDYKVLMKTTNRRSMTDSDGNPVDFGFPSMSVFYNNLGRVVRGEWWYHPDADEAAYNEEIKSGKDDWRLFIGFCMDMCVRYDHQRNGAVVTSMRNELNETTHPMPASRFLAIYQDEAESFGETDKKRLRREMVHKAYHAIMEKYHTLRQQDYTCIVNVNSTLEAYDKCNHGCNLIPKGEEGGIFRRFVDKRDELLHAAICHFDRETKTDVGVGSRNGIIAYNAWNSVNEEMDQTAEYKDFWDNRHDKALAAPHFLFLGTQYLLKGISVHDRQMAAAYALAVVYSSPEFYCHCKDGPLMKASKAIMFGDDSEVTRFLSSRISCSCLEGRLQKEPTARAGDS